MRNSPSLPLLPGLADPQVQWLRREVRLFLHVGFELYVGANVLSGIGARHRGRPPSRDAIIAEARARNLTELTQARFDGYWKSIDHYRIDLAVFARSLTWQEQVLERTRQLVVTKARSLATGNGTLGELIDDIAICDVRRRVRIAPATRKKDGLTGPHECSAGVLNADRWRYEKHESRWGEAYEEAARILGIVLPPGFLPEFRRFAAALAEGMAGRAYVAQTGSYGDADSIESFGRSLGRCLKIYISSEIPGINLDSPWVTTSSRTTP